MTKVNIKKTPSEELIAKASQEVEVTDAKGRKILLRKPGVLAQFRLVEALGDSAKNQTYVGMVLPLIFVASIDGVFVPPLEKKAHVEALIARLDDEGIAAVMEAVQGNFASTDPEAAKEELKN